MPLPLPVLRTVRRLSPELYFRARQRYRLFEESRRDGVQVRQKRAQLRVLAELARDRVVVDAGAHKGAYALEMAPTARRVLAFEPNAKLAANLGELLRFAPWDVQVFDFALSDHDGEAELEIPVKRPGSATLERDNLHVRRIAQQEPMSTQTVHLRRFDDLGLGEVGLLKINVEGHQLPLLRGAQRMLAEHRPDIFTEIDETHAEGSIDAVDGWLQEHGYRGFFLLYPVFLPMPMFDHATYHAPENWRSGRVRINDFFYFHRDRLAEAKARLPGLTFHPNGT